MGGRCCYAHKNLHLPKCLTFGIHITAAAFHAPSVNEKTTRLGGYCWCGQVPEESKTIAEIRESKNSVTVTNIVIRKLKAVLNVGILVGINQRT